MVDADTCGYANYYYERVADCHLLRRAVRNGTDTYITARATPPARAPMTRSACRDQRYDSYADGIQRWIGRKLDRPRTRESRLSSFCHMLNSSAYESYFDPYMPIWSSVLWQEA